MEQNKSDLNLHKNVINSLQYSKSNFWCYTVLDFTYEQLRQHLESQFTPEMNWDNYGSYWELDHIIPKNQFHFESYDDKEFKICWSLLNLRPLLKAENRQRPRDGSDISEEQRNEILHQFDKKGGE